MTDHTHMFSWNRTTQRAECECGLSKIPRPPQNFAAPRIGERLLRLARFMHPNANLPWDMAGLCLWCGERAYYNTSQTRAGAECVLYRYKCMACKKTDLEPLD